MSRAETLNRTPHTQHTASQTRARNYIPGRVLLPMKSKGLNRIGSNTGTKTMLEQNRHYTEKTQPYRQLNPDVQKNFAPRCLINKNHQKTKPESATTTSKPATTPHRAKSNYATRQKYFPAKSLIFYPSPHILSQKTNKRKPEE